MDIEEFKAQQLNFAERHLKTILDKFKINRKDAVINGFNTIYEAKYIKNPLAIVPDQYPPSIKKASNKMSIYGICSISLAAAHLELAYQFKRDDETAIACVQQAIFYVGAASGCIHEVAIGGAFEIEHKRQIGEKGRQTRNKPKQELKGWALQQAKSLKLPDRDAARKLSARIPDHLADASKNPEQLIYRALLERHQVK